MPLIVWDRTYTNLLVSDSAYIGVPDGVAASAIASTFATATATVTVTATDANQILEWQVTDQPLLAATSPLEIEVFS